MDKLSGITVVLFMKQDIYLRFAVFHRIYGWDGWELIKGEKEGTEDDESAIFRELKEESGIDREEVLSVKDLEFLNTWVYMKDGRRVRRVDRSYLVEVAGDTSLTLEHNDIEEHCEAYFLKPVDALRILTHRNQQELMDKAFDVLGIVL